MRWHCRCRVCRARQVKRLHPDAYKRAPVCWSCRSKGSLIVDAWANRRPWRLTTCRCGAYHYPHHAGYGLCAMPRDGSAPEIELLPQQVFDPRLD